MIDSQPIDSKSILDFYIVSVIKICIISVIIGYALNYFIIGITVGVLFDLAILSIFTVINVVLLWLMKTDYKDYVGRILIYNINFTIVLTGHPYTQVADLIFLTSILIPTLLALLLDYKTTSLTIFLSNIVCFIFIELFVDHLELGIRVIIVWYIVVIPISTFMITKYSSMQRRFTQLLDNQESEDYRLIFDDTDDAIYITSLDGKFLVYNKALLNLFKLSAEEIETIRSGDLYDDLNDRVKLHRIILEKGKVRNYEVKLRDNNDEIIYVEITSTFHKSNSGKILGYKGIMRDVTRRKLEEIDQVTKQNLEIQRQKMTLVGQLAGGVAHDFNNILSIIIGYSEYLNKKIGSNEEYREIIEEILEAGKRGSAVTQQLLGFSKKSITKLENQDLNIIIEEFKNVLDFYTRKKEVIIQYDLQSGLPSIFVDKSQIQLILLNLVINAIDAISAKGEITIRTNRITFKQSDLETNDQIQLNISDNGSGMDEAVRDKIFDPFFTTKSQGTGLGLATVSDIVNRLKGSINVTSKINEGTTISVTLPVPEEDTKPTQAVLEQGFEPDKDQIEKTILFVDDENQIRNMYSNMLSEDGFRVYVAETPEIAIEIAKRLNAKLDILISDIIMPNMNGVELSKVLREHFPNIQVIFISGYSSNFLPLEEDSKDKYEFLQKPFKYEELVKSIERSLN